MAAKVNDIIPVALAILVCVHCEKDVPVFPNFKDIKTLLGPDKNIDLWIVGTYMAAYKYFGVDFRYQAGNIEKSDQVFYKQFPLPILREMHKGVEKVCETRAVDCVLEILPIAARSGTMQHLMRRGAVLEDKQTKLLDNAAPFDKNYDMFKFRQTAMYYLCWHALMEDEYLVFDNPRVSCLEYLSFVNDVPRKARVEISEIGRYLKKPLPRYITDIRDISKMHIRDPFLCARLWFCPDPCYGRKTGGNFTEYDARDPGNPCGDLPNPVCDWKPKSNYNFKDLIRNRFNITCDCASKWPGYEWNNKFGLCVDKDECYDRVHECSYKRVCRNNVGSYSCTCPRGFDVNPETDDCEKVDILHDAAVILNVKEGLGYTMDDSDIIDDIMEFFGFSSGTFLKVYPLSILIILTSKYLV